MEATKGLFDRGRITSGSFKGTRPLYSEVMKGTDMESVRREIRRSYLGQAGAPTDMGNPVRGKQHHSPSTYT